MKLKHIFAMVAFLLIASTSFALLPVSVSGTLTKKRKQVKLFRVTEGKLVEIASTVPGNTGKFGFLFYPDYEGIFVIGTGNPSSANENYKFYFKGGEKLSLSITEFSYSLNGLQNSKENVVLTQWHDLVQPMEQKAVNFMQTSSTFVDYFPLQEEVIAKSKTFLTGKKTNNPVFDKLVKDLIKLDLASYAINFITTPRAAHPAQEEYPAYYGTLRAEDFAKNTSLIYSYPWGSRLLSSLIMTNLRQRDVKYRAGLDGLKDQLNLVPNDTLKGDLILETASRYKSFNDYKALKDQFANYILTESQKKRDLEILNPLAELKPGSPAFNFSFPDQAGKMVSMADLKGKVVLVDVWATWCGPCKAEIPHLKKLEEELSGKDVAIVSISTDADKDKEKWLKMITDEKLGGIQLFAGVKSNLMNYYKISGIPRFLLFDKQGRIVNVDSPRPSQPELKALIEKTLEN